MLVFLEIAATIFGLLQGILVMLNKRSNWIAYIIQMIFLVSFSIATNLYGDIINNSIYLILGVIGFILWNRPDNTNISACSWKGRFFYTILIILGTMLGFFILKNTNDPLPLIDSFTTISSLVATYLMMRKKTDTWIIWFINDIFYAIEYFIIPEQAIYLFLLNVVWSLMAIASYINWYKLMKDENKNEKDIFCGKI